jgi:lipopolysaccharide transport system permease protein
MAAKEDKEMKSFFERLKAKARKLFTRSNWDIFVELTRANIKVRDYNTVLGVFWSLLGPIATLFVFYFIFSKSFGQGIKAYPVFLLVSLVCINFFITATTYMVDIFFLNREIVLNSTVPRETVLASTLAVHLYKLLLDLILCVILSIIYGCATWKLFLMITPLLVSFIVFALGVNMILSLLYCFANDIGHIWMLFGRLFYFITPMFYTLDNVGPVVKRLIFFLNPLAPFVISFQNIFLGKINLPVYFYSLSVGVVFFIFGYIIFVIIENSAMEKA